MRGSFLFPKSKCYKDETKYLNSKETHLVYFTLLSLLLSFFAKASQELSNKQDKQTIKQANKQARYAMYI